MPRKWREPMPTGLTEILRPQLMVSITGSNPVLATKSCSFWNIDEVVDSLERQAT
jgi:hypothetical protein